MRVILSRKGFDGINGGMPSPIMPNGDMISMPIPSDGDRDRYSALTYKGKTYLKILRELKPSFPHCRCHLDPDLDVKRRIVRIRKWKPAFGQIGSSAAHLLKTNNIGSGDIILFFGNFHHVEEIAGRYRYVRHSGDFYCDNDVQVIWGYLQVGEVIVDPRRILHEYPWHPHACKSRLKELSNVLIIPKKHLSFAPKQSGWGVLPYSKERVLTKKGAGKATWNHNSVYAPSNITSRRRNCAANNGIYYSGIWQELGLRQSRATSEWARKIILGTIKKATPRAGLKTGMKEYDADLDRDLDDLIKK